MDALEAFGKVVRRERKRLKLSQERLADLASLHRNNVGFVERGQNAPALDTIFALAAALGTYPSVLLKATETMLTSSTERVRKSRK